MTPRVARARTRALGLALLLAIASRQAEGAELYRWVTEDGRIEIGTTPPPGTAAVPWDPGQEAVAKPAPAAAATPPRATGRAAAAEGRARAVRQSECARAKAVEEKAASKVAELEALISRLERKLEELEATELAYSRTSCVKQDVYGPDGDCQTSSFHRDSEIARTEKQIEDAQDKLGDLEQRARRAAPNEDCAPASADRD